jgi:hypothetical protein
LRISSRVGSRQTFFIVPSWLSLAYGHYLAQTS